MIQKGFVASHEVKEKNLGPEMMRTFEKAVMLRALDHHWKEHLAVMDQLRQSVNELLLNLPVRLTHFMPVS